MGCRLEPLERRVLFSTLTVNSLLDTTTADAVLTLREAVVLINNAGDATAALGRALTAGELAQIDTTNAYGTADAIAFHSSVAGGTITLGSAMSVTSVFTIDGGSSGMTVSGGVSTATWRAFSLSAGSDLTLRNLTVTCFGQTAASAAAATGGAINVGAGTLTLIGSTLTLNGVTGGAASGSGSTAGNGLGGAIAVNGGTVNLLRSTLSNNTATGGGAGGANSTAGTARGAAIYAVNATVTVVDSNLSGNTATGGNTSGSGSRGGDGEGAALYVIDSTLTVRNSTLAANTAAGGTASIAGTSTGGAIYLADGDLSLDFATVSQNAAGTARGLYVRATGAGYSLAIGNSILGQADNAVGDLVVVDPFNQLAKSGGNNLIRNGSAAGITSSSADPLLGALQNNGGPTLTMLPQSGSPAIDSAGATALTTDQRGATRPANGVADIGAVETSAAFPVGVAPAITSGGSATFTAGAASTFTVTTTGTPAPALTLAGALPGSISFTDNGDGTATISGTPTGGGVFAVTLTADNGESPAATQAFTLTVSLAPAITSADHAIFTAGTAGAFTVTTSGYPTASLLAISTLPAGVSFVDNGDGSATISGTAATGGTSYGVTITASNGVAPDATQAFTLTVNAASPDPDPDPHPDPDPDPDPDPPSPTPFETVIVGGRDVRVVNLHGWSHFEIADPFGASPSAHRVARGDVTGDGRSDIIIGTGPGVVAAVNVIDDTTGLLRCGFRPFAGYRGGVFVAGGDINGDGFADIVVGRGYRKGAAGRVRVFSGADYTLLADFVAFNAPAGVRVAVADMNGDGFADVLAGQGAGGSGRVRVFDGHALATGVATVAGVFATGLSGGIFLAAGDIDADGQPDVIVSQAKARPYVSIFSGADARLLRRWRIESETGAPLTAGDVDGDGQIDVLAAVTTGRSGAIRVFSGADDTLLATVPIDERLRFFVA